MPNATERKPGEADPAEPDKPKPETKPDKPDTKTVGGRSRPKEPPVPPPMPIQLADNADLWLAIVALRDMADRNEVWADKGRGDPSRKALVASYRANARDLRRIAKEIERCSTAHAATAEAAMPPLTKAHAKAQPKAKSRSSAAAAVVRQGARKGKK